MRQIRYVRLEQQPRHPLMQLVGLVGGIILVAVSIILGAFLLAALLGLGLLVAVVVFARLWWLRRRLGPQRAGDEIIETEYRVIRETSRGQDDASGTGDD